MTIDSKRIAIETIKHVVVTAMGGASLALYDYCDSLLAGTTPTMQSLFHHAAAGAAVAVVGLYFPRPRLDDHTRREDDPPVVATVVPVIPPVVIVTPPKEGK